MGGVTWRVEGTVAGRAEDVWAWMSDLTQDDHNSDAFLRGAGIDTSKPRKPSKRTILSREGNVLRIRDDWAGSVYEQTVTLDPEARTVRIQGQMAYDALWRIVEAGPDTRVSVEGSMGRGIQGYVMKVFAKKLQKSMETDFAGHMEDLHEALTQMQQARYAARIVGDGTGLSLAG